MLYSSHQLIVTLFNNSSLLMAFFGGIFTLLKSTTGENLMIRTKAQPTENNVVDLIPETAAVSVVNPAPLTLAVLPDLSNATEAPIELSYQYWTPVNVGEFKRGLIIGIENARYEKLDDATGEITDLELRCVIFAEQKPGGTWIKVSNGSKRLVSVIEQALKSGAIMPGKTPVQIKYTGKRKNSTNGFSCDTFEVKPLQIDVA
jgi:hypothetical protein